MTSTLRRIDEGFAVASQIAPEDLAELKVRGYALVINNRPDGEEPGQPSSAQIAAAAQAAGLDYRAIPVAGGFPPEQIRQMADAIADATGDVFAFCRTGTRSTLLWSLAQASRGCDPEQLAAAAAAAGYDIAPVRASLDALATRA